MTARLWLGAAVLGVLAVGFALMVADAAAGGDWPGWDDGWAVVVFPLGIPLAVGSGLAVAAEGSQVARVAVVTAAVWAWGAVLFLAWLAFG